MDYDRFFGEEDDVPEEVRRAFERDMASFEQTEPAQPLDALRRSGIEPAVPHSLDEVELPDALWRVIHGLAFLGIYLHHTDHLDDRELYTYLLDHALRQPVVMMPGNPNFGYHIDLIDCGGEEDEQLFLRYSADGETRERWAKEFPSVAMPPAE